jgi:IclR family transcriptional regulator, pca regulon regulatory protein
MPSRRHCRPSTDIAFRIAKRSFALYNVDAVIARCAVHLDHMATKQSKINAPARREAMGGLAKGLSVIRAFTREHATLSLSNIASLTSMPAATARRCLLTLEELGYVMRRGRQFLLRPKVLELGAAYIESMNIELLTKTHLEEMARSTGDSAALCVLDGTEIVYVARTSIRTLMRLEAHVGSRFPAYPTSMGRVLLAGQSAVGLKQYLDTVSLEPLTKYTVTDKEQLRRIVEKCRRTGYSVVKDELDYGVVALAVPVHDRQGRVVAALNSSGHSSRITAAKMVEERLHMLQGVSRQITKDLASVPGLSLSVGLPGD